MQHLCPIQKSSAEPIYRPDHCYLAPLPVNRYSPERQVCASKNNRPVSCREHLAPDQEIHSNYLTVDIHSLSPDFYNLMLIVNRVGCRDKVMIALGT